MVSRFVIWLMLFGGSVAPLVFSFSSMWVYFTVEKRGPLGSFNPYEHFFHMEVFGLKLSWAPNVTAAAMILIGFALVVIGMSIFLHSSSVSETVLE